MKSIHNLVSRLYRSHFFRNVLVMMTGTVLAQVIALAFVPVLSRVYDPATYGVFGVFLSIVGIVSCVATLRYDMALMLPKEDADAACILGLCGIVVLGIAALSGILCLAFGNQLATLLKTPELVPWLWLLPVLVFLMGAWQTLFSWSARRKQFRRASISQVAKALTGPGAQVAAGLCSANVFGLILGRIIGDVCGSATFAVQIFKHDWQLISGSLQWSRMKRLARAYADFPMYTTPQTLLNTVSQQVPLLLLAHYFGVAVVGYYAFGVRIVQMPMNLVRSSLQSVLFQKAGEVYNSGGDTYALFKKTTLGLIAIAVLPTVLIVIFAPAVAAFVLGEQWRTAGEYSRWLVLWLAIGFCNVPAMLFGQIYRRQRALLVIDIVVLVGRVSAIVVGGIFFTALQTVILYSIVGIFFNTYLIAWVWWFLKKQSMPISTEHSFDQTQTEMA